MKIGFYDDFRPCIVKENGVVDLTNEVAAMDEGSPQLLIESIIANFDSLRPRLVELQDRGNVIPLAQVRDLLDRLPKGAAVGKRDWADVSGLWREEIDYRIALLTKLRDQLDHCMGCGCLSLESCPLYNRNDSLSRQGPGPQRWVPTGSSGDPVEGT